MFDGHLRHKVDDRTGPIGQAIRRTGVTADHLTAAGLVLAVACAVAIGTGHLLLGFGLLVLSAVPDLLDGPVAKASGTQSVRGAFFDSTADRVTDSLVLGGIAWHLQSERGGHWAMLPFAVLGVSALVSYQRAKAESLGLSAKGGLMERAERVIALMVGVLVPVLLVPVLWVMLAATTLTAVQRFAKIWRQATKVREVELRDRGIVVPARRDQRRSRRRAPADRVTLEDRWQAWRQGRVTGPGRVRAGSVTASRWRDRPRRSRP